MIEPIINIIGISIGMYCGYILYTLFTDESIEKNKELTKKEDEYKI